MRTITLANRAGVDFIFVHRLVQRGLLVDHRTHKRAGYNHDWDQIDLLVAVTMARFAESFGSGVEAPRLHYVLMRKTLAAAVYSHTEAEFLVGCPSGWTAAWSAEMAVELTHQMSPCSVVCLGAIRDSLAVEEDPEDDYELPV